MGKIRSILAGAVLALTFASAAPADPLTRATVAQGELVGMRTGGVEAFLGIPYAEPPVGALRWRAPLPPASWQGVRSAEEFSPSCMQTVAPEGFGPWTSEYVVQGKVSEDCLYLNVWTPARDAHAKLPVLFWIHGGAFSAGSGSVPIYDGAPLASKGIIVVTINYRLGALGFLALPQLAAETKNAVSGNYGFLDALAALDWVHTNIAAFGGDPSAITIAGQSAGALFVLDLDVSPLAKGLYARAIAESGAALTSTSAADLRIAESAGTEFMQIVGASSIEAMRALPPEKLLTNPTTGPQFSPIVDGWSLPGDPRTLMAAGRFNDTPFLTGLNSDEASGLNPMLAAMTPDACKSYIASVSGTLASQFEQLYLSGAASCNAGIEELARDRGIAGTYFWAEARAAKTTAPVYIYLFDHPEPGPDMARYGAFHTSEVPYVFGTLDKSPSRPFTETDRKISDTMSRYWVNFVETGNPNGPGLAQWPAVTPGGDNIMELGDGFGVRHVLEATKLKAMQDYAAERGPLGLF